MNKTSPEAALVWCSLGCRSRICIGAIKCWSTKKIIQFKMKIKNEQGLYESTSLNLFYLGGKFWNFFLDLWSMEEANFKQFTASNIKENCEKIPTVSDTNSILCVDTCYKHNHGN